MKPSAWAFSSQPGRSGVLMRFIGGSGSLAPIDRHAIRRAAALGPVITAEEHNLASGFGSAVAEVIADEALGAKLVRIGVPDEYSLLGPPTHLYRHYGLDAEGVAAAVRLALARD